MSSNIDTHVRLAYNRTGHAIRFTRSALRIIQQLQFQGLPPNPIKPQSYVDAIDSLTEALFGIRALPLGIQLPPHPIAPANPIVPQDTN
ncbi:hypothetical protein [Cytobacillus oceanisediminis]|uniref:Uncharacterized protein n=1 Tax=Cytobacillus oceanisediminis TaxID=665099 RepID=A0A562K5U1_9BACI|nr:hypothetical protein [Cytobacillus oceanisediminis]TWH90811.1 hypothetical protein IQ19_00261 [Cytobacillus oceanisediminis]